MVERAICCRYWQLDTYLLPVAEWDTEQDGQQEADAAVGGGAAASAPAADGS